MVPVVSPMSGAMRMVVGLMVVVHPRAALVVTTPRRPMLAPVMPAMVPMRAASMVICRRMWARLAPRARRRPISLRRSMMLSRVALAMATVPISKARPERARKRLVMSLETWLRSCFGSGGTRAWRRSGWSGRRARGAWRPASCAAPGAVSMRTW